MLQTPTVLDDNLQFKCTFTLERDFNAWLYFKEHH